MKLLLIIFIVLFVILLVLVVFSVGLLRFVTLPKNRVPVDKAPEIEKSKDLWQCHLNLMTLPQRFALFMELMISLFYLNIAKQDTKPASSTRKFI